jgi:hypothetical protein
MATLMLGSVEICGPCGVVLTVTVAGCTSPLQGIQRLPASCLARHACHGVLGCYLRGWPAMHHRWLSPRLGICLPKQNWPKEKTARALPDEQPPAARQLPCRAAGPFCKPLAAWGPSHADPPLLNHLCWVPGSPSRAPLLSSRPACSFAIHCILSIARVTARVQREKKTLKPIIQDGKTVPLTSHTLAPVPLAIGGTGLPENVVLREDLPNAGLANVTATIIELMGFQPPAHMQPSLLATA